MKTHTLKVVLVLILLLGVSIAAVANQQPPTVELPRIDLKQVRIAFEQAQGSTATLWAQDLEWRINQIHQGQQIVRLHVSTRNIPAVISGLYPPRRLPGGAIDGMYNRMVFMIFLWKHRDGKMYFDVKDHTSWNASSTTHPRESGYAFFRFLSTRKMFYITPKQRILSLRKRRAAYRKTADFKLRTRRHLRYMQGVKIDKPRSRSYRRIMRRRGGKW